MKRYEAEGAEISRLRALTERTFMSGETDRTDIFDAYRMKDESVMALARVRRRDVLNFAKTVTDAARAERKDLILSAALMPEGAYDDSAFADLHYGQCYQDAAQLYDYALPMAYSKAYGEGGEWVRMVAKGSIRKGVRTVVGLHAYEGGTGPSLSEDIAALGSVPVDGICLFREGALAMAFAEDRKISVFNPMDRPIDRMVAYREGNEAAINEAVAPGEEKCFHLPFDPQSVRVFSGQSECSVYLTRN